MFALLLCGLKYIDAFKSCIPGLDNTWNWAQMPTDQNKILNFVILGINFILGGNI